MRTRQLLVVVSAAQLAVGVAGQIVAIRQGRTFEILRWHGNPEHVARESWFIGTGLSAPVSMLAVHAAATAVLVAQPSRRAAGTLGALGVMMAAGVVAENRIRSAIRAGGDPVVSAIGGAAFALAMAMAVVGVRGAFRGLL